jgi:CheY-like chemotaxis protein
VSDSLLRIVIAEDNYLVRECTRRLLEDGGGIDVVAAVGSADELLDAVRRLRPGVVITDIRMPPGHHMEDIAAAHAIRAGYPGNGSGGPVPARRRRLRLRAVQKRHRWARLPAKRSRR